MKPMHVAVEHFANEITKRASRSFSKAELNKEQFDKIMNSIEDIKNITNKTKKESDKDGEDNKKSE